MATLLQIDQAKARAVKIVADYNRAMDELLASTPDDIVLEVAGWIETQINSAPTEFPDIEPVWF